MWGGALLHKGLFHQALGTVFSFLPHCYAFHTHLSFISLCPVLPQSWLYFQYFFLPLSPSCFSELAENWWIENKKLALKCCCCRISKPNICFVVVRSLSRVQLFVTPWITALQASVSSTISWSLLKLMSTKSVMPSNHLILCHPLLLLPSIFPSIRVFSNESGSFPMSRGLFQWVDSSHQVAKLLELQLQHQSFQWIFRVDFL